MPEAVLVSAVRTPVGRAPKGALSTTRPDDLAATALSAALDKVPQLDRAEIEENPENHQRDCRMDLLHHEMDRAPKVTRGSPPTDPLPLMTSYLEVEVLVLLILVSLCNLGISLRSNSVSSPLS